MRAAHPTSLRRLAVPALGAALTLALSGCFTGERPTLAEEATETGDAPADAVLALLDTAGDATFTSEYDVLTRFGDITSTAIVSQNGANRRAVTIGPIRFIVDETGTATCDLDDGECTDTIDVQRISDLQLTTDFYTSSAAARLRRDTRLRAGATRASTETIAGEPATCVVVPVTGGESTYCALDSGPLARLDAADLKIDLTSYSPQPDADQFVRPG
jgi:hypothetical protein